MAILHCYWHLIVNIGNFTLLLTSHGQQWQFHIATNISWSTMARMPISHCYWHGVARMTISHYYWYVGVRNGNFTLLLTWSGQEWQFHIPTDISWSTMAISHCYWPLTVNNGNFTLLPTFHVQQCYCHVVVKNGNFTLLLTFSGKNDNFTFLLTCSSKEWQFHIAADS